MPRMSFFLAIAIFIGNVVALPYNTTIKPTVTIDNVRYQGYHNTSLNINAYLSIPFAAAPIGALRWKAPQPFIAPSNYNKSGSPIDVSQPAPSCVQGTPQPFWTGGSGPIPVTGSEDCLILQVFTPDTATPESKLPVIFNIHGGGYTTGNADWAVEYELLRHSKNAFILVSTQYRLGAYGFVGGPKYAKQGGAPNIGLLDQRLALEWAHKNIAAFGGDPEKITISGASAGGGSVTAQLAWKGGVKNPPFRAAVADFPWWQQFLRDEQLDAQFEVLLDAANCSDLESLRKLPEDVLKNATQRSYTVAYEKGAYGFGNFYYGPYVDGDVVRGLPSREFRAGRFANVPTWLSRDGYEGAVFSNTSMTTVEEEKVDLRTQFPFANESFIDKIYELYPSEDFNSTFWHRQTWFGDFIIDCPTRYVGSSVVATNKPVFKLIFDAGSQTHGAASPFLTNLDYDSSPGANVTLANTVRDFYLSFALYLDPNVKSWSNVSKPVWPDYKSDEVMTFNYTQIGAVSELYYDDTERCQFFENNGEVVQN